MLLRKRPGLRGDTGVGCSPTMEEGQGYEWPSIVKRLILLKR